MCEQALATPRQMYDVRTAAHVMGISRSTLFLLLQSGELGSVRIATRRLIPAAAIDRYIDDHLEGNSGETKRGADPQSTPLYEEGSGSAQPHY